MIEVGSIMTTDVKTIPEDMPLPDAVIYMSKLGLHGMPVMGKDGNVVGLLSERALFSDPAYVHLRTLVKLFSEMQYYKKDNSFIKDQIKDIVKLQVRDLMNPNPASLHPEDSIDEARSMLSVDANDPLLVVDAENNLVGVLGVSDLTKFYGVPIRRNLTEADVDRQIDHFVEQFEKQFMIVSKFRAKTWFVSGLILMLAGFTIAMIFILHVSQK